MATAKTEGLNEMLREYAPHSVMTDAFKKENFFFNQFGTDTGWKNGVSYQIPWELSAGATDVQMGSLLSASDLDNGLGSYKKAVLNNHKEMWGSLKFKDNDLTQYGDLKQSFLKVFPDKLTQLVDNMKMQFSTIVCRGGAITHATANGTAGGVLKVDKPQFLSIGQRVEIVDNNTAPVVAFVKQININTKDVLFHNTRDTGSVALDLSAYTIAEKARVALPGQSAESFTTLQEYLLPASAGGLDTIHGVQKISSPLLQSQHVSGASITSSTCLDFIYSFFYEVKELGKVKKSEMFVPYHLFKACVKQLQSSKRYIDGGRESGYGFSKIKILGPEGDMTLVALPDLLNSQAMLIDTDAFKFVGDTLFERKRQLTGEEFFVIRGAQGYEYVADIKLSGEFVCTKLCSSAIIYDIPYLA